MIEPEILANGKVRLYCGNCLEILPQLQENSVDSLVVDPPYHLTSTVKRFGKEGSAPCVSGTEGSKGVFGRGAKGFMGKAWDGGDVAFQAETWRAAYRVLKPGGHLLAFAGTRGYHRMACAIEDGEFEIRDMIAWMYGSGFPKSHNVSKAIDKLLGAEREKVRTSFDPSDGKFMQGFGNQRPWLDAAKETGYHEHDGDVPLSEQAKEWQGYGTALKPAMEPICVARKPFKGSVAKNVLEWACGVINIGKCFVGNEKRDTFTGGMRTTNKIYGKFANEEPATPIVTNVGRWPANVTHDGSEEATEGFPIVEVLGVPVSSARFFYTPKADADDRLGSNHPTVKPLDLMQYLVRLYTPKGGTVLDFFAGTGTTGEAAFREGFNAILVEREEEYQNDIRRRMSLVLGGPDERKHASIKAKGLVQDAGPLFGLIDTKLEIGRKIGPIGLKW
jgi:DNA modification methylase